MKATELRIGNWVYPSVGDVSAEQVTEIKSHDTIYCATERMQLIPLTEEWLERFGFENMPDSKTFTKNAFIYDLETESLYHDDESLVHSESITLHYVHQLQNLYFALTGEELIVKEHVQQG